MKSKFDEYFSYQLKSVLKHVKSSMRLSVAAMVVSTFLNLFASVYVIKSQEGWSSFFIIGVAAVLFIAPSIYSLISLRTRKLNVKVKYPGLSVVRIMSLKREGASYYSIALFVSGLMLYMAYTAITEHPSSSAVIAVLLAGAGFVLLREKLHLYRVTKGFFGNNEAEAREIIRFILSNSENIDFTDGGKQKPVFSKEEINDIIERTLKPSAVGA